MDKIKLPLSCQSPLSDDGCGVPEMPQRYLSLVARGKLYYGSGRCCHFRKSVTADGKPPFAVNP
mgnify:CR=1 FL=1